MTVTLFYIIAFSFLELVFKSAVTVHPEAASFAYPLLFSVFSGAFFSVITLRFKEKVSYIITAVIMGLNGLFFIIEFLVFREFKVCYDLKTILNAATDALGGFGSDIRALIFCVDGVFHLTLFVLPFVLWLIFGKKLLGKTKPGEWGKKDLINAIISGVSAIVIFLLLMSGLYRAGLYEEYDFQAAVNNYGFKPALLLDGGKLIMGNDSGAFESVSPDAGLLVQENITDASLNEASKNMIFNPVSGSARIAPYAVPGYLSVSAADASMNGVGFVDAEPKEYDASANAAILLFANTKNIKRDGPNTLDIDFKTLPDNGKACRELDEYVMNSVPSSRNKYTGIFKDKNLILICAEAYSGFVVDEELTPTLYRLAHKGINLNDYYQQATAGTTGGEYQLIFGMLPTSGGSSMKDATKHGGHTNIGKLLDDEGYYGMAFHDNSYTYYDRHITHNRLGYSEGFMGVGNGLEDYIGKGWPESDLEMMQATVPMYIDKEPFSIYYMTVSAHSDYSYRSNAQAKKHREETDAWCEAHGYGYSEPVRAYIASNVELDRALEYLVDELEKAGIADDTVIVLSGDHFPYGLDHNGALGKLPYLSELYGYNVTTIPERDKSRGIIWCGALEKTAPIMVDTPSSSIDMLPTLCNLFDVKWDSRLYPGRDIFSDALPVVYNGAYDWKTDKGLYLNSKGKFIPNEGAEVSDEYIRSVKAIVKNKINFSKKALSNDYYTHVFGENDDDGKESE